MLKEYKLKLDKVEHDIAEINDMLKKVNIRIIIDKSVIAVQMGIVVGDSLVNKKVFWPMVVIATLTSLLAITNIITRTNTINGLTESLEVAKSRKEHILQNKEWM